MNRRNFVVGLGTVATISGVASVTAAQFADQVSPTADFRVRPEDEQLTVDATPNFDPNQPIWTDTNLTDFNETEGTSEDIIAHLDNNSASADPQSGITDGGTNGDLVATLTFNNTNQTGGNETYDEFAHPDGGFSATAAGGGAGFFQIINNGDADKSVGLNFGYGDGVDGSNITNGMVGDSFKFVMNAGTAGTPDLKRVSPTSGTEGADPENYVQVSQGQSEVVGLEIVVTDELYEGIQAEAGGAFSETASSLQLIDEVTVGTQ